MAYKILEASRPLCLVLLQRCATELVWPWLAWYSDDNKFAFVHFKLLMEHMLFTYSMIHFTTYVVGHQNLLLSAPQLHFRDHCGPSVKTSSHSLWACSTWHTTDFVANSAQAPSNYSFTSCLAPIWLDPWRFNNKSLTGWSNQTEQYLSAQRMEADASPGFMLSHSNIFLPSTAVDYSMQLLQSSHPPAHVKRSGSFRQVWYLPSTMDSRTVS